MPKVKFNPRFYVICTILLIFVAGVLVRLFGPPAWKQKLQDIYTYGPGYIPSFATIKHFTHAGFAKLSSKVVGNDAGLGVYFVRQHVAQNSATGRIIMFAAKAKGDYSIAYSTPGVKEKIVKARDVSFQDGKDNYIQYVVHINDLQPGKDYEYRIMTAKAAGSWHKLDTPKKDFTALVFADSQSGDNYNKWLSLADKARSLNKDAAFYINLGDQVDNGAHKYQFDRWFTGVEFFSADIPMAMVLGNHECYDLNWNERFPKAHINLFHTPVAMDKYKHQFYSFDYGDVHFTVLDTNYRWEALTYQPNIVGEQLAWARRDLANSQAKWKVVLMHRDILMYKFGPESGRSSAWNTYVTETGTDFMPIFERCGVDLVLSGHMHSYRRRVPLKNFYPDKQGVTYIMSGVCGDQSKGKLWADFEWDAKRSPQPEVGNYMTLNVTGNRLTVKAFTPDGKQFDEVSFQK